MEEEKEKKRHFYVDFVEEEMRTPLTMCVLWLSEEIIDALDAKAESLFWRPHIPIVHCYVAECIRCLLDALLQIISVDPDGLDVVNFRGTLKGKISVHIAHLFIKYEDFCCNKADITNAAAGIRLREESSLLDFSKSAFKQLPFRQQRLLFAPKANNLLAIPMFDETNSETELSILYYIVTLVLGKQVVCNDNNNISKDLSSSLITEENAARICSQFKMDQETTGTDIVAIIVGKIIGNWIHGVLYQHMNAAGSYYLSKYGNELESAIRVDAKNMKQMFRIFSSPLVEQRSIAVKFCLWNLFAAYDVMVNYTPYTIKDRKYPSLPFDKITLLFTLSPDEQSSYCNLVRISGLPLVKEEDLSSSLLKYPSRTNLSRMIALFESTVHLMSSSSSTTTTVVPVGRNQFVAVDEKNNMFREWLKNRAENVIDTTNAITAVSDNNISLSTSLSSISSSVTNNIISESSFISPVVVENVDTSSSSSIIPTTHIDDNTNTTTTTAIIATNKEEKEQKEDVVNSLVTTEEPPSPILNKRQKTDIPATVTLIMEKEDFFNSLQSELMKPKLSPWFIDEMIAWYPMSKSALDSIVKLSKVALCNVTQRIIQIALADQNLITQLDNISPDSCSMSESDAMNLEANCADCNDRVLLVTCLREILQKRILLAKSQFESARIHAVLEQQKLENLMRTLQDDYNQKLASLQELHSDVLLRNSSRPSSVIPVSGFYSLTDPLYDNIPLSSSSPVSFFGPLTSSGMTPK